MDVAAGTRAIRQLYSKEQRRFFAANTTGGIELDDLSVPVRGELLPWRPGRIVAVRWHECHVIPTG
jgi:hypothetical protein